MTHTLTDDDDGGSRRRTRLINWLERAVNDDATHWPIAGMPINRVVVLRSRWLVHWKDEVFPAGCHYLVSAEI